MTDADFLYGLPVDVTETEGLGDLTGAAAIAAHLGQTERQVRWLLHLGQLPTRRRGRWLVAARADLDAWLTSKRDDDALRGAAAIAAFLGISVSTLMPGLRSGAVPTTGRRSSRTASKAELARLFPGRRLLIECPAEAAAILRGAPAIAVHLRLSVARTRALIQSGDLPSFKLGRSSCARRDDLDRWTAERRQRVRGLRAIARILAMNPTRAKRLVQMTALPVERRGKHFYASRTTLLAERARRKETLHVVRP